MSAHPRLLDLFCCEGGASEGYRRAGFEVFGVDLFQQFSRKRYPFSATAGDALEAIERVIGGCLGWRFDAIHASPPCQHASAGTRALRKHGTNEYPALIEETRGLLAQTGLPYVIENVEGSALRDPVTLCGTMFDLRAVDTDGTPLEMWRHRNFETNWHLEAPGECRHHAYSEQVAGCYGGARSDKDEARNVRHGGYVPKDKRVLEELMGIDWMTKRGLYQALPPVYTEWIGTQLRELICPAGGPHELGVQEFEGREYPACDNCGAQPKERVA